jgi:outer membrane receptor protein involved in Fe transport
MDAVTQSIELTNDQPSGFVTVYNDERNEWMNIGANFNIKHNFKEDGYISADYDYLHYDNENPTNYLNEYYDSDGSFLYDEIVKSDKDTPIDIQVISGDYSNQLNEKLKLDFGVKGAFSKFENDVSVEVFDGTEFIEDPTLTSKSDLNERILAAYTSVDYKFSEKLGGKFGLRYEYTTSLLESDTEGVIVDRKFGELFPSAFLNYKINDTLSFNGAYSRRISRPGFTQMAPFVIFFDPNTFFAGNPAIQPAISNTFNLGMSYKSYILSAQYTREEGTISRIADFDEELERVIFIAENFDQVNTFSFTLGIPVRIASWWQTQNTLILLHRSVQNDSESFTTKSEQFSYNFNHTSSFTFSESWTSEINFNYNSERVFGPNTIKANYAMNIGVQKKLKDEWGSLRFNVNDVFDSRLFQIKSEVEGQNLISDNKLDFSNRTFILTYTRTFGNKKLKSSRNRQTGAEEERRRVN